MITQFTFYNILDEAFNEALNEKPKGGKKSTDKELKLVNEWMRRVLDFVREYDDEQLFSFFHNKGSDYPLIQYRNDKGFPAIVGVGKEASLIVSNFVESFRQQLSLQEQNIVQKTVYYYPVLRSEQSVYVIEKYLFNREKRKKYNSLKAIWQDVLEVEEGLKSNISELVKKGLGLPLPDYRLEVIDIQSLIDVHTYKSYGTFFEKGAQLTFKTNLLLPQLAGIGTSKGKGYGIISSLNGS